MDLVTDANQPNARRAVWAACFFRACLTLWLLWLIESAYLPFCYARPFLGSGREWAQVYLQGLAVVVLTTPLLGLLQRGWHWTSVKLLARVPGAILSHAVTAQAALLALAGLVLVNNGRGRRFLLAPWWQSALAVLAGAAFYWVLRRRARRMPLDYARGVLFWLVLTALQWAEYATLYLGGRFGLEEPVARKRTLVLLGMTGFTALIFALFFTRQRVGRSRVGAALVAVLVVLAYCANAYFYVDDSLDLHRTLAVLALLGAWYCAEVVALPVWLSHLTRAPARVRFRALALATLTFGVAFAGLALTPKTSSARYFGGVHTTFQRFGFETQTRFLAGADAVWAPLEFCRERLVLWGVLRRAPEPGPLPESFAVNVPSISAERPAPTNLVLFLLDMKRPKDLGIYGLTATSATPHIDACFETAFVFDAAYSASNSTRVAFPSLYTGTYAASRHQNHPVLLRQSFWTQTAHKQNLGESFKAAGFRTSAVVDAWYHQELFQPARGQPVFSGFSAIHVATDGPSPDEIVKLYEARQDLFPVTDRFLTVFHVLAHEPELLPAVDHFVGSVCSDLKALGLFERTALFLTADHGVQYREHGRTTYGHTLFDEEVRVPLLLRLPDKRGRRVLDRVSAVDHLATLLDIFSIPQAFPTEGVSYLPLLLGATADPARVIFSETRKPIYSLAALQGPLKLIYWPGVDSFALFDLARDPSEITNRADDPEYAPATRFLAERIAWFRRTHQEPYWAF